MARRPRRPPRVARYFDPCKLQGYVDPFAALKDLCNPYNDAAGYVYIVRRVRRDDYRRFRTGQMTREEYRAVSQVKAGHAKNFETRQRGYSKCGVDWVLIWEMKLWTARRVLLEGLIHESLRQLGAMVPHVRCSCKKEHREFFDLVAAGGVKGVEKIALGWMYLLGQALTAKTRLR